MSRCRGAQHWLSAAFCACQREHAPVTCDMTRWRLACLERLQKGRAGAPLGRVDGAGVPCSGLHHGQCGSPGIVHTCKQLAPCRLARSACPSLQGGWLQFQCCPCPRAWAHQLLDDGLGEGLAVEALQAQRVVEGGVLGLCRGTGGRVRGEAAAVRNGRCASRGAGDSSGSGGPQMPVQPCTPICEPDAPG